jgi:zinc finger SWIM domain-containing protein 3
LQGGLYVVTNYDNAKERMVIGNPLEQKVSCDCRKFETHGILCCHALKVLDAMNIKSIPEHYILKRWTRDARVGSNQDWKGRHVELDIKAHFMMRYNELCPRMLKLTNKSSETHETYTFMSKVCEESGKIIDDMLAKKHVDGELDGEVRVSISIGKDEIDNMETVGMTRGIKARHCLRKGKKRYLSWVEKSARKTKRYSQKKNKTQSVSFFY